MSFQFLLVFFFIIVVLLRSAFKRTKLVMRVLAFLRGLFVKLFQMSDLGELTKSIVIIIIKKIK